MIDFIPTGGLITVVTLIFMVTIGRKLLPERDSPGQAAKGSARALYETYQLGERLWELKVLPESRLVNQKLAQSRIGEELGLTVLAIWRGHHAILTPEPSEVIDEGDFLLILGREERVNQLLEWGLTLGRSDGHASPQHDYAVDLTEVIIPPRSGNIGKTLTDLRFRNKFGLTTVALWRGGRSYRTDVGKMPLEVGDALLMVGSPRNIKQLQYERDFMVLQSSHADSPDAPQLAALAVIITMIVLLFSVFEIIPIAEAMLLGAVAMVLSGCLDMDEAYRAIEWRVIFLIAGMLPVSIALVNTGLAERIGAGLVGTLEPFGSLALIAGLFLLTMLVTQVLGGQVSALIVGPVAVTAALQVGINPQAVAVAVAIACSTAFLTPLAHPVNVLMMAPGGYVPKDFLKIGAWLTLITFAVLLVCMVVFWGIR
jgi:di/tricarboxylate transporter